VTLDDGDTSSNITISDLDDDEEYIVYAIASAFGKQFSPQASLAITTDEIPIPEFELLYDSLTADNGDPITLPVTQLDITGLSIGKNDELRLVYTLVGDSTTGNVCALFPNDLTTTTNYHRQGLQANGTNIVAARVNNNTFAISRSNERAVGVTDVKISNNDRFVFESGLLEGVGGESNIIRNLNLNCVGTAFTLTSITKLSIVGSRTNGITAGSRIRLYKVNTGDA
jgi:hypothetical protein